MSFLVKTVIVPFLWLSFPSDLPFSDLNRQLTAINNLAQFVRGHEVRTTT